MFEEARGVNVCEHPIRFPDRRAKLAQKLTLVHVTPRLELLLPLANIRVSTEAADDPLSNVAIEVEDQIADAVGCRVGSPPDVLNRQSLDCLLDPRYVAVGQEPSRLIDECS